MFNGIRGNMFFFRLFHMIKCQGRLGNQLFEYAFAYAVGKTTHHLVIFDNREYMFSVPQYFRTKSLSLLLSKTPVVRKYYRRICKRFEVLFDHCSDDIENITDKKNVYFDGFYQSVFFFENYQGEIRKTLLIKKNYQKHFFAKYGNLIHNNIKYVVIHIRKGDYCSFGSALGFNNPDVSLPYQYYMCALNSIEELYQYKIYVIGDDLGTIKAEMKSLNMDISYEHNDEIIDFMLLQKANIRIISNSSFAWWAAYLGNKESITYAPKYWLGWREKVEFPNRISYGLNWEWIEI